MKKLMILLVLASLATGLSAQKKISHVLRKYKNDANVMNINLNGDLSNMIKQSDMEIKSQIDLLDVLVFEKGTDVSDKHKSTIKNILNETGYDLLVNAKDKRGKLKVYIKENTEHIEELYAVLFAEGLNIHFILAGEIQYEDLSKLSMPFDGGEIFSEGVKE